MSQSLARHAAIVLMLIISSLTPRAAGAQTSALSAGTAVLEQIEREGCPEGAGRLIFKRLPLIALDLGAGPQFEVVIDYNAMVCSENSLAYRRFNGAPVLLFHADEQYGFISKWIRFVVIEDQMRMEIGGSALMCEEQGLSDCFRRIHVNQAGELVIEYVPLDEAANGR